MNYNMSIATSIYLENDLELLHRIWEGGEKASSKDLLLYPDSREFNLGKEVL
jgi:hypothetical protein